MRRLLRAGALFCSLFTFPTLSYALDVDSLPVWNPDILLDKAATPEPVDTAQAENRLETHGY